MSVPWFCQLLNGSVLNLTHFPDRGFLCEALGEALSGHDHPRESCTLWWSHFSTHTLPLTTCTSHGSPDSSQASTEHDSGVPTGLEAIDRMLLPSRLDFAPPNWGTLGWFFYLFRPWFPNNKMRGLPCDSETIMNLNHKGNVATSSAVIVWISSFPNNETVMRAEKGKLRDSSHFSQH